MNQHTSTHKLESFARVLQRYVCIWLHMCAYVCTWAHMLAYGHICVHMGTSESLALPMDLNDPHAKFMKILFFQKMLFFVKSFKFIGRANDSELQISKNLIFYMKNLWFLYENTIYVSVLGKWVFLIFQNSL